jgi:toxin ParE1/3/4
VRLILAPAAQRDLEDILRYTEQNWDRVQRDRYRDRIREGLAHLARHPEIGKAIASGNTDAWKFVIGSHVVFYRVDAGKIQIARIVHHRRASVLESMED